MEVRGWRVGIEGAESLESLGGKLIFFRILVLAYVLVHE